VLRLTSPVNVAVVRNEQRIKPGKETAEYVARRHKIFFLPHFPEARTVELDTNLPRAETAQRLRQLLWGLLGVPVAGGPHLLGRLPGADRASGTKEDAIVQP
jgi:hypothetical protein